MEVIRETLPSGLEATFVRAPHYQTTSARLNFLAGSLHQDPNVPAGVAHFLEHTPFQGTDQLPTQKAVQEYSDEDGTDFNAYTSQFTTAYTADGTDASRVLNLVFQLGFHPLLTEQGMNDDRNAIVEEAREDQYFPYRGEVENYRRQFGGPRYAELIQGNIEDVQKITRQHIIDFYRAHYQIDNAQLVVASSEPISKIRKLANNLAGEVDTNRTTTEPTPIYFNLPWLAHPEPVTTYHNALDHDEAQSGISVGYYLEMPKTFEAYTLQNLGAALINKTIFHLLRDDLNLVYGVTADISELENTGHGVAEGYYALEIETSLIGTNVIGALDAILKVQETVGKQKKYAGSVLAAKVKEIKKAMEADTETVADAVNGSAQLYYEQTYDPSAELAIVHGFTAAEVAREASRLMRDRRLTNIAGPSKPQLKKAAAHASKYR